MSSDGSARWGDFDDADYADDADDANDADGADDADDAAFPYSNFDDILSCSTILMNYFRGSRGQRSEGFGSETGAEMDADR
jgi:hypothetical protein